MANDCEYPAMALMKFWPFYTVELMYRLDHIQLVFFPMDQQPMYIVQIKSQ